MADDREAFVGIGVAKLRMPSRLQKQAGKERFASSVRSTRRRPACAGSLNGSPADYCITAFVAEPSDQAIRAIARRTDLIAEMHTIKPGERHSVPAVRLHAIARFSRDQRWRNNVSPLGSATSAPGPERTGRRTTSLKHR